MCLFSFLFSCVCHIFIFLNHARRSVCVYIFKVLEANRCEILSELRVWVKNVIVLWEGGFYLNRYVFYKCLHSLHFGHLWHNAGEKHLGGKKKVLYHESVNMLFLLYLYKEVFCFSSDDSSNSCL